MSLQYKTTHITEALSNLVTQFKDKPVLSALITAFITQIQELEAVFNDLIVKRILDDAEGVQLDGIGSIVGEERQGRSDDDYRVAIRARISLNLSEGTPEDVIYLIQSISDGSVIELVDYYPAAFTVEIEDNIDIGVIDPVKVAAFLRSGKPAGVKAHLLYHPTQPFRFDSGPGFDTGHYGGVAE